MESRFERKLVRVYPIKIIFKGDYYRRKLRGISANSFGLIASARRDRRGEDPSREAVHTIDACTVFRTRYITVHPSRRSPFPRPPFAFVSSFVLRSFVQHRSPLLLLHNSYTTWTGGENRESLPVYIPRQPLATTSQWPTLRFVRSSSHHSSSTGKIFHDTKMSALSALKRLVSSPFLWEYRWSNSDGERRRVW